LLIKAPVRPEAIISPTDPYIALGDELTLRVSDQPENTYQWSPADSLSCITCPTLTVRPTEQTTYRVTVTSPDSCTATDEVVVFVDRRRKVYVPNAFSPNADGTNDLLIVYPGQAVRTLKKFAVYDRWGGLRFQVTDVDLAQLTSTGWDGQTDGKPAVGGVYVWQAEVEFIDGGVEIFRGSVALIE
jgi:gliding motility-associated-like protein